MISSRIDVKIPHEKINNHITIPLKQEYSMWAKVLRQSIKDDGGIYLKIDTINHGCTDVALYLGGIEDVDYKIAEGIIMCMSRKTLKQIIVALQAAHDTIEGND